MTDRDYICRQIESPRDAEERVVSQRGATYPVDYAYDEFGDKISMTTYRDINNAGDVTRWLRDEATGLVTNKVYADGKGPRYDYTPDGKLATRIWARGIITTYSYDANGALTNTVYSDGTPTISLAYNRVGQQIRAEDAAGVTTFAYDDFGAVTNETVIGVAGTNTIERFYDTFGRSLGYSLNGIRQSTLAYDPTTGRLASMLAAGSDTPFTWNYLAGSNLKFSLAYPNGLTASWTYDANGQLLQVKNAFSTNTISQYDYVYDAARRRINVSKSGTAFNHDDTIAYGYNEKSELTNAVAAVDAAYRYSYDFDEIGNREFSSERGTNSVYTANDLNQYTAVDDFAPQFDDDGNQTLVKTETGVWQVTYNGENRPVLWTLINSFTPNSSTPTLLSMSYDRMGRRVTKNDQRFVYDGYMQIADNGGNAYIWDPTENVATRPLVWNCGNSVVYYMHDGNKNMSEGVAVNGDIVAHYEYAPFGARTVSCGASAAANPWRFSSEYAEDDTATVYYNYRHYEPVMGRWMSRDPIEEYGGIRLYEWCCNDCACVDYAGLACEKRGGAGFSWPFEGQLGAGVSASASLSISVMGYDCCCDGKMIYGDAYEIGVTGQVTLGLGVGAHVKLPVLGTVGGTIEGPKYAWDVAAHYIKECGEEDRYWDITIFEWVGKLGGGGVIGAAFGVSGGYWLNYHVGAHLIIDHGDLSFKVIVGTDRGLDVSVETPLGNCDWEFFHHDETEEAK